MTLTRLVWRSLLAHPLRMVLTVLAVMVGIFLYCFLTSIVGSLDAAVKAGHWIARSAITDEKGMRWPADPADPK